MKDLKKCPWCEWQEATTPNVFLRHVINCDHAPPDGKEHSAKLLAARTAVREEPIVCCLLRKKVALLPVVRSEEESGIADSEVLDVSTFETSQNGHPVITFRFCPWCGKPWVRSGVMIDPHPAPRGDHL